MASVLDGIRVLDLSTGIAGPVTGMLLADHGADVVKVEPPGGDPFRGSPGYDAWLRGRRSAVLDLVEPADRRRFLALAGTADVVLESFAPGTSARLGVDPGTLLSRNPRLIHCSITAYGRHAGHRHRPGYDALVAARLGIHDVQRSHLGGAVPYMHGEEPFLPDLEIPEGMEPGSPRDGPIFTYTPWLSMCTALLATTGISAALLARVHTGLGQLVETSMLQAALNVTASKWQRAENPHAVGYRSWVYDRRAPKGFFLCSDGRWVQQWVPNPRFVLSSADGDTLALRRDVSRSRDDPERVPPDPENIVVLAHYFPEMVEAFARFPSDEWVEVARQAGTPLQPVRTPEEALADPALIAEGAVVEVDSPEHGRLRQAGILYGLSRTPGRVRGPAPLAGQHTGEIVAGADGAAWPARPAGPAPTRSSGAGSTPSGPTRSGSARSGTSPSGSAPLDGITVIDLGFAVAGPFGTQVLADLGASVIKVNAWRDPWWHAQHIAYGANRGKRSIGIDLKTPEGLQVFHRLVERADVVHSNMRRDALQRLKCDDASVREVNPDIIYCHTRGFDRGPRSDSPGNDQTGCSLAGVTWEDGGCGDGGKPFWSLTSLGDTGNGFLSAIGVVQALYHRALTGEAQSVDTSILNAGMLVSSMASLTADGTPLPRPHLDRMQLGLSPFYRLYETADGWVCMAAVRAEHRAALASAVGDPEVLDERVSSGAPASSGGPWPGGPTSPAGARLETWFRARTAAEAFRTLDDHGVPCEITDPDMGQRVFDDPEMQRHGLVVHQQHPRLGRFDHFGTTIHFSDTPGRVFGPPPLCGQHTREIMHEHGFEDAEIDKLISAKAVFEELWVD
jgi:crotonobetainyl-CoA:carnitine CoA-transferase CaiB-like acyl-CoA transferase